MSTIPRKATGPTGLRERIEREALRLFASRGYSAVSIRDIAGAVGTTNSAIYYYFPGKEALYRHILGEQTKGLRERLDEAADRPGTAMERLDSFVAAYLDFYMDNPRSAFVIREVFGLGTDMYRDVVSDLDGVMRRALRRVLEAGAEEGVFRADGHEMVVISILGILNTFARRSAVGARVLSRDAARAQVIDFFVNGLGAREDRVERPKAGAGGAQR